MPIDRYIGVKLSTIDMFGSQVAVRDYLEPAVIESTARYWARFWNSSGYVIAAVPRIWERVDSGVSVGGRTVHDSELERSALDSLLGRPVPRQMNFRELAVIRFLDERFIDPAEITATRMVMA
jgi:hypothetical protein